MSREQRIGSAHLIKTHVRMPKAIGALVGQPSIIIGVDFPDIVKIALIDDLRIRQADFGSLDLGRLAAFQRTQPPAEGDVLFIRWRFIMADHANRLAGQRSSHLAHGGLIHGLADIHACQPRSVKWVQGFNPNRHKRSPLSFI